MTRLAQIALLVRDYDEAIAYFVGVLGFTLVEDTPTATRGKRWVVVRPPGDGGAAVLLAKAVGARQEAAIGDQAGGRVFLFLATADFATDHARMTAAGVRFTEAPRQEPYGSVAVFEDLYGNRWDLVEQRSAGA
ncbi:VOC family protein [Sphingomonas sp. RS2018]